MLMNNDEWPTKIQKNNVFYEWTDNWNANEPLIFQNKLLGLDITPNETIYIFWMRELAIKTLWQVFCHNWINFLYEDEGCLVFGKQMDTALLLSNGKCWVGSKT
ncbi:MAG TPA: DUF2947 family protein [Oligoflexia bacterium]|nr:DUF2947 family protein [Oligoflexia bacterium]HMR25073.1 DUF2947 family protein [Oligoflexia bacterium]